MSFSKTTVDKVNPGLVDAVPLGFSLKFLLLSHEVIRDVSIDLDLIIKGNKK